ncbi:MAG TPA: hypothetical protein DCR40_16750 [Prolixibacteraceae bacterium]|nr:hypothetical protein [Prolixibacteraceae bacterium]
MNEKIDKFLEFNGKRLIMLARNGTSWIAIKPICEALEVDYASQVKKIEECDFFTEHSSYQTMVDTDGKLLKMICLPEYIIVDWILKIESNNPKLADLKSECYQVINDHSILRLLARKCN